MFMAFLLAFQLFLPTPGQAAQADNFGLGTMSTGRVDSVLADPANPYAALFNPSLLSAQTSPLFSFTTASAAASYDPLPAVMPPRSASRTTGADAPATVQIPGYQSALWAAGLTYPFTLPFWSAHHAGLGVALSGPYDALRSFSAGSPADFYALRYGTSDRQFKGTGGLSLELLPQHLFAGIGVSLFVTGAGDGETSIAAADPSSRLAMDVGLNTAAVMGLFGHWGDTGVGLVYRQVINPVFTQRFNGRVQLGPTDILSQPILLQTSLYYEPHTAEADLQQDFRWGKVSVGVAYERWRDYQPSYLVTSTSEPDGTPRIGRLPAIPFHDTWNPRFSLELPVREWFTVDAGYEYRPSPVGDLSGDGNIIDADTHIWGLGLRHRFRPSPAFPWALSLGLFGQYHAMVGRDVHKASPASVGSPHYRISGSAYTYGASLEAEL